MPKQDTQLTFWKGLSGRFQGTALEGNIFVAETEEVDGRRLHRITDFYGDYADDIDEATFPTSDELLQLVADKHIVELAPQPPHPTDLPDLITLTVTRSTARMDPPVTIFRAVLKSSRGEWPETFGSVEQLEKFLTGLNAAFSQVGVFTNFSWDIPSTWSEPSCVRWKVPKDGLPEQEKLNSNGEVITI